MKFRSLIYAMSLLLAAPFFAACNDDDTKEEVTTIETTRIKNVTHDSAVAVSYIVGNYSDRGICYSENQNPTIAGKTLPAVGNIEFESEITGLTSGKTYYVRTYAIVNGQPVYGAQKSFTTLSDGQPIVTIGEATNIKETTAELSAFVMSTGGKEVTVRGIAWVKDEGDLDEIVDKITSTGTIPDDVMDRAGAYVDSENATGELKATATDLADESDYGYVAFVVADGEVFLSDASTFTTIAYNKPVAKLNKIYDVTMSSLSVDAESAYPDNELEITARGVHYSTQNEPGTGTDVPAATNGVGEYTVKINNLSDGEIYYIWAYAENKKGRTYSTIGSATTPSNRPIVEVNVADLLGHSATASVRITSLGLANAPVSEVGFIWSDSKGLTVDNGNKVTMDEVPALNANSDSAIMRWLKGNTTYYIRAYAINEYGVAYGAEIPFTTREDLYDAQIRSVSKGGTSLPYFNSWQCIVDDAKNTSYNTVPADKLSPDFAEWYEQLEAAVLTSQGRVLAGFVYCLTETSDGNLVFGNTFYYYNSTLANRYYSGYTHIQFVRNEDGSFRFVKKNKNTGGFYSGLNTANKAIADKVFTYFTEHDFFFEWGAPDYKFTSTIDKTNAPIRMVAKDDPDNYWAFASNNVSTADFVGPIANPF